MVTLSKSDYAAILARNSKSEPVKTRKKTGEGDWAKYKAWQAEMCRLPGTFLPTRIYSEANEHDRWAQIKRTKDQRESAWLAVLSHLKHHPMALPVKVTLTRYGKKLLDDDNLARAFKAVRDGIADAFGVDDSARSGLSFVYKQEVAGHYGYRIELGVSK